MTATTNIQPNDIMTISFSRGKIITRITLCLAFMIFILFCLLQSSNSIRPIFLFLMLVNVHILIFHAFCHLKQYNNGTQGLKLDGKGIWNNTADTPVFIPWSEIEEFQTGFYRTNHQIFIRISNPDNYHEIKRSTYLTLINRVGKFFRSKPDLLWIDINLLNINEKQLLKLLNSKLKESKAD